MVMQPDPKMSIASLLQAAPQHTVDYRTRGRSGLQLQSGYVLEEKMRALQGQRGLEVFSEMAQNDYVIGNSMNLLYRSARGAKHRVENASDHPNDREAGQFLEQCLEDMDYTFGDTIADVARGMVQYGFSLNEMVYKRRCGDSPEPWLKSKFSDGRVGLRGLPTRSQNTITRWGTDDLGSFTFVEQVSPPDYRAIEIPYDKVLHFRQSSYKNNPLGQSSLRCIYIAWYLKTRLRNMQAVGAERSVCGLPVIKVPPEVLAAQTPEDAAMLQRCIQIATNIRIDEEGGIVFPQAYDENNNLMYEIELMSASGSQIMDLDKIIMGLDFNIASALNTEFTQLGISGGATGSYAMHADKTDLYAGMMNNLMSVIADNINRFLIPRLFSLNNFTVTEYPRIAFGDMGTTNIKDLGAFLQSAAGAGAVLFPNGPAEDRIMEIAGLPPLPQNEGSKPQMEPLGVADPKQVNEIHDGDVDLNDQELAPGGNAVVPTIQGNL